jgi:hypothetical protein
MNSLRVFTRCTVVKALAGCATIRNEPVNLSVSDTSAAAIIGRDDPTKAS